VNGVDQGVAFSDLPFDTPLYGAVTLYTKDSQIVYNVRGSVGLCVHNVPTLAYLCSCLFAGFIGSYEYLVHTTMSFRWCLSQALDVGLADTWQTSQQRKGKEISISGTMVTKTNQSWGFGTAVVSDSVILQPGSRVKKRWSFTIKAGNQNTIGVVTAAYNAESDEYVNKTNNGWGYYQGDGNKGHGDSANKAYGAAYKTGDVVDGL
jgi:hypothetical protein